MGDKERNEGSSLTGTNVAPLPSHDDVETEVDIMAKGRSTQVLVDSLLELVEQDYITNNRASYGHVRSSIKRLKERFGHLPSNSIRTELLERYRDEMRSIGRAKATINLEFAVLRRAYKLATERTPPLVTQAPKIPFYTIGKSNRRKGFFEYEMAVALEPHLKPYQRPVLWFGYFSGWRQGEIISLKWDENYNDTAKVIRIYDTKNTDGRVLPLTMVPKLTEVIQEQLETRRLIQRLRGVDCPYIFHRDGCLIQRSTFNVDWRAACKKAGVERHFHDLRRTAVRNLMRAGVHRAIAKQITGHKSDAVFERYDIVDEQDIAGGLLKMVSYVEEQKRRIQPPDPTSPPSTSRLNAGPNLTGRDALSNKDDFPQHFRWVRRLFSKKREE